MLATGAVQEYDMETYTKVDRLSTFKVAAHTRPPAAGADPTHVAFDVHAFNRLEHSRVASKHDVCACVDALGALILAHGLEDNCGVWRVHNHFQLSDDECVVGHLTAEGRINVAPSRIDEGNQLGTHFCLADSICQPMQFMGADGALGDLVRANQLAVFEKPGFLAAYAELAAQLGVADKLGLYVVYEDLLPGSASGVMEDTEEESRTQTLRPYVLESSIWPGNTTLWRFEKIEGGMGVAVKKHNCACGHTRHHH
jgi:hypothetical protein